MGDIYRIINQDFFCINADKLAVKLLGKALVVKTNNKISRFLIAETECYMGVEDTACHASRGKTPRASTLWERGGTLYVRLIYGLHYMLNIVAGPYGEPMGVLIRGAREVKGPGNLTRKLNIGKDFNREDLLTSNRIWIEDLGITPTYKSTPRIGIGYADKYDRDIHWRFEAYDYFRHSSPKDE